MKHTNPETIELIYNLLRHHVTTNTQLTPSSDVIDRSDVIRALFSASRRLHVLMSLWAVNQKEY